MFFTLVFLLIESNIHRRCMTRKLKSSLYCLRQKAHNVVQLARCLSDITSEINQK